MPPTRPACTPSGWAAARLVADPDEAKAYVAQRVAEGVDYIKIIVDPPGFDEATVRALVDAAHANGLRTIGHAATRDAVLLAQAAGIDVLTHAPLDRLLEDVGVVRGWLRSPSPAAPGAARPAGSRSALSCAGAGGAERRAPSARRVSRIATATISAAVAAPVITSVIVPYAVDRTNRCTGPAVLSPFGVSELHRQREDT